VPLHDLALFGCQWTWLQENLIRDRYFADIVDNAAASQGNALLVVPARTLLRKSFQFDVAI
jgi:hypothetical protein